MSSLNTTNNFVSVWRCALMTMLVVLAACLHWAPRVQCQLQTSTTTTSSSTSAITTTNDPTTSTYLSSTTESKATSSATTKPHRTASNAINVSDDFSICRSKYAKFHANHTACLKPNRNCKITKKGITRRQQKQILDVHNYYRNLIASGNESRLGFPAASNMLTLEWDNDLAYVAQKHANQCHFEHDCYDCRRTDRYEVVGQNLYIYRTTRTSIEPQWSYVIKEWYDEIKIAPPEVARSFELFDLNIGHFTQIAWANTNRIGCGFTTYDNNEVDDQENAIFKTVQLYTCNYAPGGNYLGEKMYKNGTAATQCPSHYTRSKKFRSLCEFVRKTRKSNKKKSKNKNKPRRSNRELTTQKPLVTSVTTTRIPATISTTTSSISSSSRRPWLNRWTKPLVTSVTTNRIPATTSTTISSISSTSKRPWLNRWTSSWTTSAKPSRTTRVPTYTWSVSFKYRQNETIPVKYLSFLVNKNGITATTTKKFKNN